MRVDVVFGRSVGLVDAPSGRPGDHICWAFSTATEFVAAATGFLREGLQRREQLVFVADLDSEQQLLSLLTGLGDLEALVSLGTLRVVPVGKQYVADVGLDRHLQVAAYRDLTMAAVAQGYAGLRIAVDATSLVGTPADRRRFLAYELDVDRVMADQPMTAMCAYNAAVHPQAAREISVVHPCQHATEDPGFRLYQGGDGLRLHGHVDVTNRDLFATALHAAGVVEPATVRIDLAELGFVDVRGLVTLDEFAAALSGTGRRLVLTNAEPVLRRGAELLELGHLTEALEVR